MDHAVALVQAYLRVNGYFTVSEYPIIESIRHGHRTATEIDIPAFRFSSAGRLVPGRASSDEEYLREHWEIVRHEDQKDLALGFLSLLEKSRHDTA